MLVGTVCWSAFALAVVAWQGVVMDEVTVPAQIISGLVKYPGGHPHDIFYRTTYSFPNIAGAWFLSLWHNEVVLSAVRNWLFLSLSLVTPFVVTLVLARRAAWAHVATALTLFEGHLLYEGTYPMRVFPILYSHGHVGLQLAVLAAAVLAGRRWLSGGVLAGMTPAIHAAMTVVLWPWVAGYVFWLRKTRDRAAARRLLVGFGVGALFSVGVALLIRLFSHPLPPVPPYDTLAGTPGARVGFEAVTDTHRIAPALVSHGYLLGPVAFLALSYVLLWSTSIRGQRRSDGYVAAAAIAALGMVAMVIVYGAWLTQLAFGRIPDAAAMVMPYRLSNVSATLLIPVSIGTVATIVRLMNERDRLITGAATALAVAALGVAMSGLVRLDLREVVVSLMLPALWGLPFGLALWTLGPDRAQRWHVLLPLGGTVLAAFALWATTKAALVLIGATAACVCGVWLARRLAQNLNLAVLRGVSSVGMGAAILACVLGALSDRKLDRDRTGGDSAMISGDDRAIRSWLAANATADELVLTPMMPRVELQAKTRQPVLFEAATLWLMTYMPSLAPRVGAMARDLYGIDYERAGDSARQCPDGLLTYWCEVWNDAWRMRTPAAWVDLGRKYHFRLVMASPEVKLSLPLVLETRTVNLYEIPNGRAGQDTDMTEPSISGR